MLRRVEPAAPAPGPVRPRRRHAAVVTEAARDAADDGPADASVGVGHDQVLVRDPDLGGDRLGLVEVAGRLHAQERRVQPAVAQRHPGERAAATGIVGVHHGAPDRRLGHLRLRRLALHLDRLGRALEHPRALGRQVGVGVPGVRLQQDEVGPVALAVRETPGDVAVAARHHQGRAGQRHAGDAPLTVRPGEHQREPVPGVRHGDAEVHVVGDERAPVNAVRPRHGPAVAPAGVVVVVPHGTDPYRHAEQGECVRCRERARRGGGRGLRASQVEDLRPRQRRQRDLVALDRGVPFRAHRGEEGRELGRERLTHQAEHGLPPRLAALQVAVHRERAQQRVLFAPRYRLGAQRQVLEGGRPERAEAGVHSLGVGREQIALVGAQRLDRAAGHQPEPQRAHLAVHGERRPAEERGELARGAAPQQVHLEEALLRVQEAGGAGHVEAALAAHHRHAARVALDADRRAQPGERALARGERQARAQPRVEVRAGPASGERQRRECAAHDARPAAPPGHLGECRHLRPQAPAFDWLATASAAFLAASGSPR